MGQTSGTAGFEVARAARDDLSRDGARNLVPWVPRCSRERVDVSASSAPWIALAVVALLALLVQTLRAAWARRARTSAIRERARHAVAGEQLAEPLLRAAGYEVLERQARGGWTVYADGEPTAIGLRADLLVAKDGRRYVAEVKTGKLAPRLDHAATRRQLLEYRIAFGVDGVLLVDADAGRVRSVELGVGADAGDDGAGARRSGAVVLVVLAAALGVVAGWLLHG